MITGENLQERNLVRKIRSSWFSLFKVTINVQRWESSDSAIYIKQDLITAVPR